MEQLQGTLVHRTRESGKTYLVTYRHYVPEHAFMGQINANTHTTILLCLGALAVATLMGYLTSHWITQPILQINRASQAMASGNLDQTLDIKNIQELNVLSHSFNYMAGQLRESFSALETSKTELEDRVEERTAELKTALSELHHSQAQMVQTSTNGSK